METPSSAFRPSSQDSGYQWQAAPASPLFLDQFEAVDRPDGALLAIDLDRGTVAAGLPVADANGVVRRVPAMSQRDRYQALKRAKVVIDRLHRQYSDVVQAENEHAERRRRQERDARIADRRAEDRTSLREGFDVDDDDVRS